MKNKKVLMRLDNKEFFLNDVNYAHFQSQTPIVQEAIKQSMMLKYLQSIYDEN